MRGSLGRNLLLVALTGITFAGCDKVKGTYSNEVGVVTLDLESRGEASLTFMGESAACNYKVRGKEIALTCPDQDEMVFNIQGDGSLTGPPGNLIGALRKRES
jgi:hypothetical protein